MTLAAKRDDDPHMSVQEFRVFQEAQPNGQRWELIDGDAVMMAPPKIAHQVIAMNLTQLLNTALGTHAPSHFAVFAPGIDLGVPEDVSRRAGTTSDYVPEPDVAVIEHSMDPDLRIARTALVLAEVVSSTDHRYIPRDNRTWIEVKTALYREHAPCRAVIVVQQEKVAIEVWQKKDDRWSREELTDPDDVMTIACCGLECRVRDVYANTHLAFVHDVQPRP